MSRVDPLIRGVLEAADLLEAWAYNKWCYDSLEDSFEYIELIGGMFAKFIARERTPEHADRFESEFSCCLAVIRDFIVSNPVVWTQCSDSTRETSSRGRLVRIADNPGSISSGPSSEKSASSVLQQAQKAIEAAIEVSELLFGWGRQFCDSEPGELDTSEEVDNSRPSVEPDLHLTGLLSQAIKCEDWTIKIRDLVEKTGIPKSTIGDNPLWKTYARIKKAPDLSRRELHEFRAKLSEPDIGPDS